MYVSFYGMVEKFIIKIKIFEGKCRQAGRKWFKKY